MDKGRLPAYHQTRRLFFLKSALMVWLASTALKVYADTAPTPAPSTCTDEIA